MIQIPAMDDLATILGLPVVGVFLLLLSEVLLYMMKVHVRALNEEKVPSSIIIWYCESYYEHTFFWNLVRYILWTLGVSAIAIWLQIVTGELGFSALACLLLMLRFVIPNAFPSKSSSSP